MGAPPRSAPLGACVPGVRVPGVRVPASLRALLSSRRRELRGFPSGPWGLVSSHGAKGRVSLTSAVRGQGLALWPDARSVREDGCPLPCRFRLRPLSAAEGGRRRPHPPPSRRRLPLAPSGLAAGTGAVSERARARASRRHRGLRPGRQRGGSEPFRGGGSCPGKPALSPSWADPLSRGPWDLSLSEPLLCDVSIASGRCRHGIFPSFYFSFYLCI